MSKSIMSKSVEVDGKTTSATSLLYKPSYISQDEETRLMGIIDAEPWCYEFRRRRQHYGYKYNYSRRPSNKSGKLGPLPSWLVELGERFLQDGLVSQLPDAVVINEYQPGQGIAAHIDCVRCFGGIVIALSLHSDCVIDFIHPHTEQKESLLLETRSLLVLQGHARYSWRHGIAARKTDKIDGVSVARQRRLSVTFRNVLV